MTTIKRIMALVCVAGCMSPVIGAEKKPFQVVALIDNYDFAKVFDVETAEGTRAILNHVLLTGADTLLWRPCGGATPRYQSREEAFPPIESPLDKRRIPESRPPYGWLRFYNAEPDMIRDALSETARRGLTGGIHWPFEETHWMSWTFGAWNFEHPQFWGRNAAGQPWAGRVSLAYPEVMEHKLRLLDELLERGAQIIYIDTWRGGAWSPRWEYVEPHLDTWKKRYGGEAPKDTQDPRWLEIVAETQHAYFKAMRARMDGTGRKVRFMFGLCELDMPGKSDATYRDRGIDWRRLVREHVIDALVVHHTAFNEQKPFEQAKAICQSVISECGKDVDVLLPVMAYDYAPGIPSYARAAGISREEAMGRLVRMAQECGAAGIVLECVDFNNYTPAMRRMLHETLAPLRR